MPTDGGQFLQSPDGALGISSVQLPDAGVYTCVATNDAGSDAAEVTVQVQGACVGPRSCPGLGWQGLPASAVGLGLCRAGLSAAHCYVMQKPHLV